MRISTIAMVVLLALAACNSEKKATPDQTTAAPDTKGAASQISPPPLRFSPHDLQTSVGSTALRLVIDESGSYKVLSDADLNRLASGASLETYPAGNKVPIKVHVVRADKSSGVEAETAIVLRPVAPLANQWHAMRLSAPTAGVVTTQFVNITGMRRDANGDLLSRFHPGVQPVVEYIQIAGVAANVSPDHMGIMFSENVDFTAPSDTLFRFEQGGKPLAFTTSGPPTSAKSLDISFSAPYSLSQPMTIYIKPGIVSSAPSHLPLSAPPGATLSPIKIVIDQLPKTGSTGPVYTYQTPL